MSCQQHILNYTSFRLKHFQIKMWEICWYYSSFRSILCTCVQCIQSMHLNTGLYSSFLLNTVRCHGYTVHKSTREHSARLWGRDTCPKEKPTFLVTRRNTPTFIHHDRLGYKQAQDNKMTSSSYHSTFPYFVVMNNMFWHVKQSMHINAM